MIKLFLKLSLFLPILIGMMLVSWRIDPSGLFWGAGFERIASEYMLQGNYINGYERLDGRKLNEVYAKNVPYAPQVLVNGSSRSMMLDSSFAQGKTFYNAANVGADIYDFFTSYYIFSKENLEPEIMVLSIDPWIFHKNPETIDKRSNKELYYEFMGEQLGYTDYEYEKPNPMEKYLALLDPSYFQGSISYYFKDKSLEVQPEPVPSEERYNQKEVIKSFDGSIIYDKNFRFRPQEQIDFDALTLVNNGITRITNFSVPDKGYLQQFTRFIEYLQAKNIKVILFLPPYHPIVYQGALEQAQSYQGFFLVEQICRETAATYSLEIYGSYNPFALQLDNTDFYDGIHIKPESLKKIFPVIQ